MTELPFCVSSFQRWLTFFLTPFVSPNIGVGSSNNYAYLVVDDKSKDAVIIDPANPPE